MQLPRRSAVWNRRASALSCAVGWSLTHNGIPLFHPLWSLREMGRPHLIWWPSVEVCSHCPHTQEVKAVNEDGLVGRRSQGFHLQPPQCHQCRECDCQWHLKYPSVFDIPSLHSSFSLSLGHLCILHSGYHTEVLNISLPTIRIPTLQCTLIHDNIDSVCILSRKFKWDLNQMDLLI